MILWLIIFDALPACDGWTDKQTDMPPIAKLCSRKAEHDIN